MVQKALSIARQPDGLRRLVGWSIAVVGALALIDRALFGAASGIAAAPALAAALSATLLTALATGVGALPVLAARTLSIRTTDALLGFGAGVMLAAIGFSLLVPALDAAEALGAGRALGATLVASGLVAGALALLALDRYLPHAHSVQGREGRDAARARRMWLFVFAIALHNLPEGLAVGVAAANGQGAALTLGIAVQNVPEGLVVAAALAGLGYSRAVAVSVAFATGLLEPVGGLLGAGLATASAAALPWTLALAAGAMLFVVVHEVIPELFGSDRGSIESHREAATQVAQGRDARAGAAGMLGIVGGFAAMVFMNAALA